MPLTDYIETTRDILEGQGLGEAPAIRRCASSASVTVSGKIATFVLNAGEGAKVRAGHVLSAVSPDDAAKAYCFYVLDVSTDTVTARNGHKGAPAIANASSDLDGGLLYHNPTHLEHKLHDRVDAIFDKLLYPQAFYLDTTTIASPDLSSNEDELPANLEGVKSVHQIIGTERYPIPYLVEKPVHTTISSTGAIGYFEYIDGSTVYITYKRKLAIGDETAEAALVDLVSTGAAALAMGASVSETDTERAKKDSQNRQPESAASILWRDFVTLRATFSEELSRDTVTHFFIERG